MKQKCSLYLSLALLVVASSGLEQEAFFILRACRATANAIVFVAATTTWQAYNDWGGANFYEGVGAGSDGELELGCARATTVQRPWARGQIRMPEGAPRVLSSGTDR